MDITKKKSMAPKYFFLYLGMMVSLYVSVGSLIVLLFEIINKLYPDPLNGYIDPFSSSMRFAIASLIIVFPVYLWVTHYLAKDTESNSEAKEFGLRKWLIYLTLFISGIIIVGDLVALINTFLSGELTIRFVFKALVILVITGGVFGSYGYVIKTERPKKKVINTFLISAIIITLASIIAGFFIVGSPVTARKIRFDQERVNDLQNLQWQIVDYWQTTGVLPKDLKEISETVFGFKIPIDPVTEESYQYNVINSLTFELCAEFALPSRENSNYEIVRPVTLVDGLKGQNSWQHDNGQVCFERIINPDYYKKL